MPAAKHFVLCNIYVVQRDACEVRKPYAKEWAKIHVREAVNQLDVDLEAMSDDVRKRWDELVTHQEAERLHQRRATIGRNRPDKR